MFFLKHESSPEMRFIAIQSPPGRVLAVQNGINPDIPESFLLIKDSRAYAKSEAMLLLAGYLKSPWSWLAILRFLPRQFRDWFYDCIAQNRYRLFGRTVTCVVPNATTRSRFTLPKS
jgi:predicted DCC family thiol-disulfide oxidoreductase YuxK